MLQPRHLSPLRARSSHPPRRSSIASISESVSAIVHAYIAMPASYDELLENLKVLESEKVENLTRIDELTTEVARVNRKSKNNLLLMNKTLLELKTQYDESLLALRKENDSLKEANQMLKSSLNFPSLLKKGSDVIDGVESAENTPLNGNVSRLGRGTVASDENKANGNTRASLLSSPIQSINIDEHFDFPDASPATIKVISHRNHHTHNTLLQHTYTAMT